METTLQEVAQQLQQARYEQIQASFEQYYADVVPLLRSSGITYRVECASYGKELPRLVFLPPKAMLSKKSVSYAMQPTGELSDGHEPPFSSAQLIEVLSAQVEGWWEAQRADGKTVIRKGFKWLLIGAFITLVTGLHAGVFLFFLGLSSFIWFIGWFAILNADVRGDYMQLIVGVRTILVSASQALVKR